MVNEILMSVRVSAPLAPATFFSLLIAVTDDASIGDALGPRERVEDVAEPVDQLGQ